MEGCTKRNVTQNGMSLELKVTQLKLKFKLEYHPKQNVTEMESYSKWSVNQNRMSLKMDCNSKWNVPQNKILQKKRMSPKIDFT